MDNRQKRTLVLAGIIGTLFGCYDEDEQTKLHKELHSRIGRGIRKSVKKFGVVDVTTITHKDGNEIWAKAVDHFADKKITIEASACILSLWNMDERKLSRDFGLSSAKIGKWAVPSKRDDRVKLEIGSREVAKFVFDAINDFYGIVEEEKMGVLERIALHKAKKS